MRTFWVDALGVAWEVVAVTAVDTESSARYVEDVKRLHAFLAQALGEVE
jgi:hypothetical protein